MQKAVGSRQLLLSAFCLLLTVLCLLPSVLHAQQPQTGTAPIFATNAKYVNGVAPGYWPTAGSGLTLNISAGTVFCAGAVQNYAGGTLTMTASTTNYVYLSSASSCAPAVKTALFTTADVPVAQVVTSAFAITSVSDLRTMFSNTTKNINNAVYANQFATSGNGNGLTPYTSPSGTGGIQEAYNALIAETQGTVGGRLVIPKGFYLITSTVNFTENGAVGGPGFYNHWSLVVEGDGEDSTYISCQTGAGKPCMDFAGRSHVTVKNMTLYRAASGYSTIGLFFARSTTGDSQFSEYNTVDHVTVGMSPSDMTANGGNGLIALYDNGAEGLRVDNSHLYADWPVILTGDNVFSITSQFVPANTSNKFMSNSVIYHTDLQALGTNPPALIQGQADNTSFTDTLPIGPTTGFCFDVRAQVTSPGNPIRGLRFLNTQTDGSCGRFLKTTSLLQGLEISGTLQQGTGSSILLSGANAGIQGSVINLVYASASPAEPLVGDDGVANQGVKANKIYLYSGASINAPTTAGNGNVFISNFNSPGITWSNSAKTDLVVTPGVTTILPSIGGETVSAAPRSTYSSFLPGALTATSTGSTLTLDKAVTVTRIQAQAKTAPSGCTTNAVVRLTDGTTPQTVTITGAANDSGAITQNYAAGAALTVGVSTAAAGCTTNPQDTTVIVQMRMQ